MQDETRKFLLSLISDRMSSFRNEQNLTQEQTSEILRISPRSYRDLEHGVSICSLQTYLQFSTRLPREAALDLLEEYKKRLRDEAENHGLD